MCVLLGQTRWLAAAEIPGAGLTPFLFFFWQLTEGATDHTG